MASIHPHPSISYLDQGTQMPMDSQALVHSHQSCTASQADLQLRLATFSQQRDREILRSNHLIKEKIVLTDENRRLHGDNKRLREENDGLCGENNRLREDYSRLHEENETIKNTAAKRHEGLTNQCEELNRQCGNLVKENQQLRLDLKLESEKELMVAFQTLYYNLANTCNRYSQRDEGFDIRPETVNEIEKLLHIRDKISQKFLNLPACRLALSTACLSQLLVEKVFHNPAYDIEPSNPKDLWADSAMAGTLASVERYMYTSGMSLDLYSKMDF
jgi:hypothetical protein